MKQRRFMNQVKGCCVLFVQTECTQEKSTETIHEEDQWVVPLTLCPKEACEPRPTAKRCTAGSPSLLR